MIIVTTGRTTGKKASQVTLHGSVTGLSESEYGFYRGFQWGFDEACSDYWWRENGYWEADMSWAHTVELDPGAVYYFKAGVDVRMAG